MIRLARLVRALKSDLRTLWFALRHPGTPWYVPVLAVALAAYAVSPIDLILDFIPFFGFLDDLTLVSAGIWLLLKLVPKPVLAQGRAHSEQRLLEQAAKPRSAVGRIFLVALVCVAGWGVYRLVTG